MYAWKLSRCVEGRRGSFLTGLDDTAVGDEDTIEELTLVLGTNLAHLHDLGALKGDNSLVDTLEDEIVLLDGVGVTDGGSLLEDNLLVVLTTEEVLNGDAGAVSGDNSVDGEMSVDELHDVFATL